jgi:tRNA modification GTPase
MLAPRSYTREDVVELQCHGSEVCLNRVLRACLEAGARLAEPGQFFHCYFLIYKTELLRELTHKKKKKKPRMVMLYCFR